MICQKMQIQSFRNIESCEVSLSPEVNLFFGDNAQGKTNFLEAVYFSSLGKSFRPVKEAELIRFGDSQAAIVNTFADALRTQTISVRMFNGRARRVIEHNGVKISRMSEIVGTFRVVLFCPEHLSLIQGGPELRRAYLNVALSQLRPVYLQALQRYNHVLKERNALLKRAHDDLATFADTEPIWSAQLAREAALITVHRARYVRQVNGQVKALFADMMKKYEDNREIPHLTYMPTLGDGFGEEGEDLTHENLDKIEARYLDLLSSRHEREIGAGSTLYGIHRDDIKITLNDRPARLYASQGQQRSLALAMKLAEGWVSAHESGGDMPVFLFDDVLSELDSHRREYLVREMRGRQVIMTACDPATAYFGQEAANMVEVKNGVYLKRSAPSAL